MLKKGEGGHTSPSTAQYHDLFSLIILVNTLLLLSSRMRIRGRSSKILPRADTSPQSSKSGISSHTPTGRDSRRLRINTPGRCSTSRIPRPPRTRTVLLQPTHPPTHPHASSLCRSRTNRDKATTQLLQVHIIR